jgi:3D (Asp-Asp-Asp) domain-containing protein
MKSRIGIIIIFGILAGFIMYLLFFANSEPFTASSGDNVNVGSTQYNINNYDLKFHDSAEDIQVQNSKSSIQPDTVVITDAKGKKTKVSRDKTQGSLIYNDPEYYKYGTAAFVPTYEESILLSKTHGIYPSVFELPTTVPTTSSPKAGDEEEKDGK